MLQLRGSGLSARLITPKVLSDGSLSDNMVNLASSVTFDAWSRVEIEIDYQSAPRMVTVRVDGAVAAQQTLDAELFVPDSFDVTIGTGYSSGSGPEWRLLFDNFTADWE